jgi:hypothetical protein
MRERLRQINTRGLLTGRRATAILTGLTLLVLALSRDPVPGVSVDPDCAEVAS